MNVSKLRARLSPGDRTPRSGVGRRSVLTGMASAAVLGPLAVAGASPAAASTAGPTGGGGERPLVIGHRGASGYRPEHTLASYELAARMGADYMECDLVSTKDGELVCRHEPEIGGTTDVARHPEFANRKTAKTIDGTRYEGWFTEDFTLAELRTLRAVERIPDIRPRNRIYDGRYPIPTFTELIELRKRLSAELHREIGIYPEIKHSTYFAGLGKAIEPRFVATLNRAGLNRRGAPVFVQSFETKNLRELRKQLKLPLVQLTDATGAPADLVAAGDKRTWADLTTAAGLKEISTYADAVGPNKDQVIARNPDVSLGAVTPLVRDAHAAGLIVHPYTFRNENSFLPANLRSPGAESEYGDVFAEYRAFLATGIDGVFSDNPDTALAAVTGR
ncbi:glycerophosphoryl diester phosphodiesterase [Pseudonocardia sediminis]|uniref:glycerophosphodiester phosphodiesterase n=2 Tax=Pseudonocardia sediminis TaxID=1397368 RepID=A0A4Q7UUB5_PSEST|nr:glycerophosphodiester phosphodiesterase [Pseudonocardia sediminis]RZT83613.1 glycerophosphoryl diester phosphodiesterase [Pseudonocardia sediminis]